MDVISRKQAVGTLPWKKRKEKKREEKLRKQQKAPHIN